MSTAFVLDPTVRSKGRARGLGVDAVCCLLHNLIPGGSGRQWIRLLGRHVEGGGRATIFAPPGRLAGPARAAGIEVVLTEWPESGAIERGLARRIGAHDAAIVHWDHLVMDAFEPALEACGRAALAIHQAPGAPERWPDREAAARARRPLEAALGSRRAVALVRGAAHRNRFVEELGVAAERMRILPASIPLPAAVPPPPRRDGEILALTRLAPEKEAIVRLAVELAAAAEALDRPRPLAIAGEGPWRSRASALCAERLPRGRWRIEPPPADPLERLAAAGLVVAQGLTTLEAAALGRRVVVARMLDAETPAGAVLRQRNYGEAAQDPFGRPALDAEPAALLAEAEALGERELEAIRRLVESRNGLEAGFRALADALAATSLRGRLGALLGRRQP